MKKKIKTVGKFMVSSLALAPVAALAQWTIPQDTQLPSATIYDIIHNIMFWLLAILGFIALIGFVISGIMYLLAAGDEDSQARAKRAMIYSITGVIVGLVGLVILYAVERMLGATANF